jgi:hypothetical protein
MTYQERQKQYLEAEIGQGRYHFRHGDHDLALDFSELP